MTDHQKTELKLELLACVVLVLMLNKRLREDQMDTLATVSMLGGSFIGMIGWLVFMMYQNDNRVDERIYDQDFNAYPFAQGIMFPVLGSLLAQCLRHGIPAAYNRKSLLFAFGANSPVNITTPLLSSSDPDDVENPEHSIERPTI